MSQFCEMALLVSVLCFSLLVNVLYLFPSQRLTVAGIEGSLSSLVEAHSYRGMKAADFPLQRHKVTSSWQLVGILGTISLRGQGLHVVMTCRQLENLRHNLP